MTVPALAPEEFSAFFHQVHGVAPFPWQRRLALQVARLGAWPEVLALPTGSGKTAVLDIAVFQLALEVDFGVQRRAPVRIAFVVDRRLIVDDAFRRAERIAETLRQTGTDTVAGRVAQRLCCLSGDALPLLVRRLRGGIPREDDWARSPAQPTILCSTVDQVGSRLLFRGYGVSDRAKPIHAGLIGADCRILLDEAHMAEPFRQTLRWVQHYRDEGWRGLPGRPWGVSLLTATPRGGPLGADGEVFGLEAEDVANPVLARRLEAQKPARLVGPGRSGGLRTGRRPADASQQAETDSGAADLERRVDALTEQVRQALATMRADGVAMPAIAVVVNRVRRARMLFERLRVEGMADDADVTLLIGPARPVDRDELAASLQPMRTGASRTFMRPQVVVATQCIEAGVDLDFDGLITELAPLDALCQRFGRLNRDGRPIVPYAAVVVAGSDITPRYEDPVYGRSLRAAWEYLSSVANGVAVDFGPSAFAARVQTQPIPLEASSPSADAPVLMPAHLDLLSQTSPVPLADPEVDLYLHGPRRQASSVAVVWRADIDPDDGDPELDTRTRRLLLLMPPRAAEAIELPVWAVRAWLQRQADALNALADVAGDSGEVGSGSVNSRGARAFRWAGDDDRSTWVDASAIRAGDMVVVPSRYGGADAYGWDPPAAAGLAPVPDVADVAAAPFAAGNFAVRVAPGLLQDAHVPYPDAHGSTGPDLRQNALQAEIRARRLREALAVAGSDNWRRVRDAVLAIGLPDAIAGALDRLASARGRGRRVEVYLDLYGREADGPRGVVFLAPLGVRAAVGQVLSAPAATEDDIAGSMPGYPETLGEHSAAVEAMAERFARLAGLPESLVADLRLAGWLHDIGKADPRFQALLASGDPLGPDPERMLAKSGRRTPGPVAGRERLPPRWRHEALSVRLVPQHPRFLAESHRDGRDAELVLWLVGVHHGWGRPFFPHHDPLDATRRELPSVLGAALDLQPGPGPQSLAYEMGGVDWPGLYERLKVRYGMWDLACLEASLRLADHRASEAAANRAAEEGEAR